MSVRRTRWLLAVWLVAGSNAAIAQASKVPVYSTGATLVKVVVSVEDGDGRPVPGLTATDFRLREDGREQPVKVFARADQPAADESMALDLALLVDTSDSMLESLRRSREAAARFLASLPNARDVLVILFDQALRQVRFDSDRPQDLFAWLDTVRGGGNTALYDAIHATVTRLRSQGGRAAIVLLTDSLDTTSRTTPAELDRMMKGSPVILYPIAFVPLAADGDKANQGFAYLDRLARLTGGRAYHQAGEKTLPVILAAVLSDLRNQYILGYELPFGVRDRRYRTLEVSVRRRKGLTLRHRFGYQPGG